MTLSPFALVLLVGALALALGGASLGLLVALIVLAFVIEVLVASARAARNSPTL